MPVISALYLLLKAFFAMAILRLIPLLHMLRLSSEIIFYKQTMVQAKKFFCLGNISEIHVLLYISVLHVQMHKAPHEN